MSLIYHQKHRFLNKIFYLLLYIALYAHPQRADANLVTLSKLPLKASTIKNIMEGKIVVNSEVKDFKKSKLNYQKLAFSITGLHKKSCYYSAPKLSKYEDYKTYMSFIEKSFYNETTKRVYLLIDTQILPGKFVLNFIIPRIKKEGVYKFTFDKGFLKGLIGNIHVSKYKSNCLYYITANWEGIHTGYPNILLELFASTTTRLSMEKLFRATGNY